MITLLLVLLALAALVILFLVISGIVAVAWPLLLVIVLFIVDLAVAKALFGRKKSKDKDK